MASNSISEIIKYSLPIFTFALGQFVTSRSNEDKNLSSLQLDFIINDEKIKEQKKFLNSYLENLNKSLYDLISFPDLEKIEIKSLSVLVGEEGYNRNYMSPKIIGQAYQTQKLITKYNK